MKEMNPARKSLNLKSAGACKPCERETELKRNEEKRMAITFKAGCKWVRLLDGITHGSTSQRAKRLAHQVEPEK
jgi:hypothetical protein